MKAKLNEKKLVNSLYQLYHSEFFPALEQWLNEMTVEDDLQKRSLNPFDQPYKISKLDGGTERILAILQNLEDIGNRK